MSDMAHSDGIDRTIFSSIPEAIDDIRQGRMVLVVDDADRENEGDFIMAAEACTPDDVNFMVTHGRGIVCLPCAAWRLDELGIPQMVTDTDRRARGGVHGLDRLPPWHHHGHERARSGDHREGRDGERCGAAGLPEAGARLPAASQGRRRAPACRAHRGGRRPRDDGGHVPRRCDLRGHERGRHDGAHARADPRRPRARHEADLDRRHDRVPAPSRGAGAAGGRGGDPDPARGVPVLRLREPGRRQDPRRARDG